MQLILMTMMLSGPVFYHHFINKAPYSETFQYFLLGCGGTLGIFISMLVNRWRVRRNELKAMRGEGGDERI